jgi:hypothetical protein
MERNKLIQWLIIMSAVIVCSLMIIISYLLNLYDNQLLIVVGIIGGIHGIALAIFRVKYSK